MFARGGNRIIVVVAAWRRELSFALLTVAPNYGEYFLVTL